MKTVLANNQQVAHYFANSTQREGRGSNFYFDADKLWSYGRHFCVARRLSADVFVMTLRTYGPSTAKHLAYTRAALRGRTVVEANDPDESAAWNRRAAEADIIAKLDEAGTTRRIQDKTRDALRSTALHIAERFNAYLAALPEVEREGVAPFDVDGESMAALRQARIDRAAAEQAEREAEQKRRADAQREQLAEWLAGGSLRGSLHALPVALRLHKKQWNELGHKVASGDADVIQTSHGAEIPVSDALRLWPLIEAVRTEYHSPDEALRLCRRVGVYNVSEFRRDGSLRVGCHDIAYTELQRMAVLLGLIPTATINA